LNTIPNTLLIEKDIPPRRAAWKNILLFAHTFNGYKHWIILHKSKQALVQSLTDLRTCLFYEARRWNHLEKNPNKAGLGYVHALVEAIRVRVQAKDFS
jgi:hypothetical protein